MADKKNKFIARASKGGDLMVKKQGAGITEKQLESLKAFEKRKLDFENGKGKPLTDKQDIDRKRLISKRDAPPELSDTAKSMIRETWAENEKGVRKLITSKYMEKGLYVEEEGISLLTDIDGVFYKKNEERKTNQFFTGECDIFNKMESGLKVVQDVKASWSVNTFMDATWELKYEWQGRIYMELWDADEFWLRYCLLDCPPHIYAGEEYKFKMYNNIIDEYLEENQAKMQEFERAHIFSTNPKFKDPKERVKTYKIKRDKEKFEELLEIMPMAQTYYDQLKLNQKSDLDAFTAKGYYPET